LVSSLYFLISGEIFKLSLALSLPGFNLVFNIDRLSAFFILLAALISLLASIYAFDYLKHYEGKYNLGWLGFFYNIFIFSLFLVPAADNILFFLVVWELMSIASYFLVIFEKDKPENIKAGFIYFLMTHVGTAFILIAFLLLNKYTGLSDFSAISAVAGQIPASILVLIFITSLLGFGMKAGIIPLHIWLPEAHPAAPSHVSAIMSGVMIKMGIYMLFRLFVDVLPNLPLWMGVVVLILGAASALLGVLNALAEHDIKRLLAYHSIENIGIILLGLGSGLIFITLGLKGLAAVALVASLFHVINHGIFKALLFLGAGSVINATHTRNMEEYGGLIKRMPQTALYFLIGSLAISALPPFNGFFSEWLCFQSLFAGINLGGSLSLLFLISAGFLVLTSALAAACFVKAFGISFLARPRSEEAEHAKEVGSSMLFGMGFLAGLTLIFGIFSGTISNLLLKTTIGLKNLSGASIDSIFNFNNLRVASDWSVVSAPVIFGGLLLALLITIGAVYLISRKNKVQSGRTWDCGNDLKPRMEITATGFSRSIVTIFQGVLKPTRQTTVEYHDDEMRYFPKRQSVDLGRHDSYQQHFYAPLKKISYWLSEVTKKIQNGNVNAYILYVFLTLIVLLLITLR
ncbi:MAG: proton-conducting transporter membrane subunit, partial [Patescibacteria group bacterium]